MPNKNAPAGFKVVGDFAGAVTEQTRQYFIPATDATATFVGDIVKLTGESNADGVPIVTTVTAVSDVPVGVVVGFLADPDNLKLRHRPASTARYALIVDNPQVVMEVQATGATGTGAPGSNVQISLAVAGSAVTGQSGEQVDSATIATTATHGFKIVGFPQRVDNDIASNNAKVLVQFNRHQFANQVAGV